MPATDSLATSSNGAAALPRVLGIAGSLRKAAISTALLRAMAPLLEGRAQFEVMTLNDVPLYDADLDTAEALPEGVRRLKQAIAAADGLLLCSPEYNYGIPGVLKNAIDWASRPGFNSVLKGKPALIVTTSPGAFGGVRAQAQIRDVLAAVLARPIARAHLAVPAADKKVADGRIADDATRALLDAGVADLLGEIALVQRRP